MKTLLTVGCAMALVAPAFTGTALAAASATGFNRYTVDSAGNISLGSQCSTANGCVVLINEPGLLQARVADAAGNQFFQTINSDNASTAAGGSVPIDGNGHPTLFRNEAFVGVGSTNIGPAGVNNNNGTYSVAALNYVDIGKETDATAGQSYVDTAIKEGSLPGFVSAGPALQIDQQNVAGSGNQTVTTNFEFKRNGLGGTDFTSDGGASLRIDQTGPINDTGDGVTPDYFTVRATSGVFTVAAGKAENAGGGMGFSVHDHIQAVWMTSQVDNADGNGGTTGSDGVFEYASLDDFTTARDAGTANDSTAEDGSGVTTVTWDPAGPGWWNGSPGLTANLGATTAAFPTDPNLALGAVP